MVVVPELVCELFGEYIIGETVAELDWDVVWVVEDVDLVDDADDDEDDADDDEDEGYVGWVVFCCCGSE